MAETIYASTWTNTGASQSGSFTGTPPAGTYAATSNLQSQRTGSGFSKSQVWSNSSITVAWSSGTVRCGSDSEGIGSSTSALFLEYSINSGSTWISLASWVDNNESEDGLGISIAAGSVTTASLGITDPSVVRFRFRGYRGPKLGAGGFPGACSITITDFRIDGVTASNASITTFDIYPGYTGSAGNPKLYDAGTYLQLRTANATSASISAIGAVGVNSDTYIAPTVTTSYTVTAQPGSVQASATVYVQTVSVGAPTPGGSYVSVGYQKQFSQGAVSGASNTGVTWSTNGGSINSSGLYTAPGTPGTYTVWNTSSADPTKSNSTTINVVALPSISSFTAARTTITSGQSTTLTPVFTP